MHSPTEAERDFIFTFFAMSIFLLIIAGFILFISGKSGLTYAVLQIDKEMVVGEIINKDKYGAEYKFTDSNNTEIRNYISHRLVKKFNLNFKDPVTVIFNPRFPTLYALQIEEIDLKFEFKMSIGALLAILGAIILSSYARSKYIDQKAILKRY